MSTTSYSIETVQTSWEGLDLGPGLAKGSTIQEARTEGSWSLKVLANGRSGVRSYSADKSGTLTILVDQQSQVHRQLLSLALRDRRDKDVVGPFVVKDSSNGQTHTYADAFIMTEPDHSFADVAADVSWVFSFLRVDHTDVNGDPLL